MPRLSPFNIGLSSEERLKLESIARKYTSPYCDVIRAKIILLADEGLSNDVIATRLDTPRQIVSKWRKRFSLAPIPRCTALGRMTKPACSNIPAVRCAAMRYNRLPSCPNCLAMKSH